jgi:hypothetical protein
MALDCTPPPQLHTMTGSPLTLLASRTNALRRLAHALVQYVRAERLVTNSLPQPSHVLIIA